MKHYKETVTVLWICFVIAAGFSAEARISDKQYLPPKLKSFNEQAVFLGFLSRELPDLFEEGTEYDVDLLGFLSNQQVAVDFLEKQPLYKQALKQRGHLLEIELRRQVKVKPKTAAVVHPELVATVEKKWKEISADAEEALKKWSEKAVKEAVKFQKDYPGLKLRGAITGLISLLPVEDRPALFRKSMLEQVQLLYSNPYFETLEANLGAFRFKDVGLPSSHAHTLMSTVTDAVERMDQIQRHLIFLAVAEQLAGVGDNTDPQQVLQDILIRNKSVPRSVTKTGTAFLTELWKELVPSVLQKVSGDALPEVHTMFRLKEAPGYLATLRGFVGVDCATQYSFPYGLLPNERTFFVIDSEGVVLGYVMLTEVTSGNQSLIYLHDFSGPRVNPLMVSQTIAALQYSFKEQGYHGLVLPTRENSHRNVNFKHIRKAMDLLAVQGKVVAIEYNDADLRLKMQEIKGLQISHDYDAPEANQQGHLIDDAELGGLEVVTSKAAWPEVGTEPLSKEEAALVALEIDFPVWSIFSQDALAEAQKLTESPNGVQLQRRQAAYQLAQSAGLYSSFIDASALVLANPNKELGDAFLRTVRNHFQSYGISLEDLTPSHSHLLHMGILNSSSLFYSRFTKQGPMSADFTLANKLTLEALRSVLLHRDRPKFLDNVMSQNLEALTTQPGFDDLIEDLSRERFESLDALDWFLHQGVSAKFFAPHLGKLQEIALHSDDEDCRKVAAQVVKQIAAGLQLDHDTCADLLIAELSPKKKGGK